MTVSEEEFVDYACEELLQVIAHMAKFPDRAEIPSPRQVTIELQMLYRAGVTKADVDEALTVWGTSRVYIKDDWGYVRTVIWKRRARMLADQ